MLWKKNVNLSWACVAGTLRPRIAGGRTARESHPHDHGVVIVAGRARVTLGEEGHGGAKIEQLLGPVLARVALIAPHEVAESVAIVRPWKLSAQTMISASSSGTPRTS